MASKKRRQLLALGGALGLAACKKETTEKAAVAGAPPEAGLTMRPYGERSPYEKTVRGAREATKSVGVGSSRTPHQDLYGSITPSSLHFERHHAGVPVIDPAKHRLVVHGLVGQALEFSLDDLLRVEALALELDALR